MMTHANDVQQIMRDIQSPYLVVVALYGTQGHLKTAGFRKIHSDLWVQCHSVGLSILKGFNRREIDYFSSWNRLNTLSWIS